MIGAALHKGVKLAKKKAGKVIRKTMRTNGPRAQQGIRDKYHPQSKLDKAMGRRRERDPSAGGRN